jgi:hypothetical protein
MDKEAGLRQKLSLFWPYLNERSRRLVAAAEALQLGRGGVSCLSRLSGLSRVTITKGIRELEDESVPLSRLRRAGAGRPSLLRADPGLPEVLEALMEPSTGKAPDSPLRWTCKGTRDLARKLSGQGRSVSHEKVAQYLRSMNYSLQGNRNTERSQSDADRNDRFARINGQVRRAMASKIPVIAMETRRRAPIGNRDMAERLSRPCPQGLYDLGMNRGFVNIWSDQETGAFALASLRGWWQHEGRGLFPRATALLIAADSQSVNVHRTRNWRSELQQTADELRLPLAVCHLPPGIHKWNGEGRRLFSFIASNWRAEPLSDYETTVYLIARNVNAGGLAAVCRLDRRKCRFSRKVIYPEIAPTPLLSKADTCEWHYTVRPGC